MASETELRLFIPSPRATIGLYGVRRLARVFLELLQVAVRRFGVSLQHAIPSAPHAHGPDAISLASVDAGDEPQGCTRTARAAGRTDAPKLRTATTLRLNFRVSRDGAG